MGDSGVASMTMDSMTVANNNSRSLSVGDSREVCERRTSNSKSEGKNGDYAVSPAVERRNKGVFGRLKNFASRASYNNSDDGHSHSSDYEELEDETKRTEASFYRESRERTSSNSWAGKVRDLHRDVKKKLSRLRNTRTPNQGETTGDAIDSPDQGSSVESIPSGSGSSLQPPTPTSSNRSSTSVGEDDQCTYVGTFIGRARALVDCTPSPYDKDGLAFKKGDIIDIIAKHKTGLWVGVSQGKFGHFKFINVEEIKESKRKSRHLSKKINTDFLKRPETLEELLKQLDLEEHLNVLVLNGYDELDAFKEIDKADLDSLGIVDVEHSSKLLRATELLQGVDLEDDFEDEESQIKPSPRDSGCYGSHENLTNTDLAHRNLANGNFIINLEDTNTSQPHNDLTDHPDSGLTINNLDLHSLVDETSTPSITIDSNSFNIPSQAEVMPYQRSNSISVPGIETLVPRSDMDCGPHSVPYLFTGAKSSPGSPRKIRSKHSRNKSHSHRVPQVDYSFSLQSYNRHSSDMYPSKGGYVFSWMTFPRGDGKIDRNGRDFGDVLSDPSNEVGDSPRSYIFKRVKQRKGSLQTLIHDNRTPSQAIIAKVNKKLVSEKIYLHEEPYTDKTGFCGIPPALVQRYSEELQMGIVDVSDTLDHIRITSLQQQNRRGVPNDFLSDSCLVPVIEPNYSNLEMWLTSIGLPMYVSNFHSSGVTELHHAATLGADDLVHMGIYNSLHQIFLESAITVLYLRFRKRPIQIFQQNDL